MNALPPVTPSKIKYIGQDRGGLTAGKIVLVMIVTSVISFFALCAVAVVANAQADAQARAHARLSTYVGDAPVLITGCDTEDSCVASYANGEWTITPVVP